jgi:hypothetical protein
MATRTRLDTVKWLRATASFVFIAALCASAALVVIAFVPGSPVRAQLPAPIGKLTVLAGLGAWAVSEVAGTVLARTMLESSTPLRPHHSPLGWLVVGLILTGFGLILDRGVEMRDELDTVI